MKRNKQTEDAASVAPAAEPEGQTRAPIYTSLKSADGLDAQIQMLAPQKAKQAMQKDGPTLADLLVAAVSLHAKNGSTAKVGAFLNAFSSASSVQISKLRTALSGVSNPPSKKFDAATWGESRKAVIADIIGKIDPSRATVLLCAAFSASSEKLRATVGNPASLIAGADFGWLKNTGQLNQVAKALEPGGEALVARFVETAAPTWLADKTAIKACRASHLSRLLQRVLGDAKAKELLLKQGLGAVLEGGDLSSLMADEGTGAFLTELVTDRNVAVNGAVLSAWVAHHKASSSACQKVAGWVNDAEAIKWLADRLSGNANPSAEVVGLLDGMAPNVSGVNSLAQLFSARFNCGLGGGFDLGGLKKIWEALQVLPVGHITKANIGVFMREKQQGTAVTGKYEKASSARKGVAKVAYDSKDLDRPMEKDWKVHENFKKIQQLPHVARHEAGHAVDQKLGIMANGRTDAKKGGWRIQSDGHDIAMDLLNDTGIQSVVSGPTLQKMAKLLAATPEPGVVKSVLTEDEIAKVRATNMPKIVQIVGQAGEGHYTQPLSSTTAGGHGYGYIPKDSTNSWDPSRWGWIQYNASQRSSAELTQYQWRAPAEWFAEVYACYYDGDPKKPGELVGARDPAAKEMMDKIHKQLPTDD